MKKLTIIGNILMWTACLLSGYFCYGKPIEFSAVYQHTPLWVWAIFFVGAISCYFGLWYSWKK